MTGEVPTRFGDVLILTKEEMPLHVVFFIYKDAQQVGTAHYEEASGRDAAVEKAGALVSPEGRIFLKDQDSGQWDQISN